MVLKLVKVVLIAFDENGLIETIVAVFFYYQIHIPLENLNGTSNGIW